MFCKRTAIPIAFLGACFFVSCSRDASPRGPADRLGILPFENLTSATDLDWVSRLSAAVLAYDLTGRWDIHPIRVDSIIDARVNRARREVQGYFANEHGALAFHATLANRAIVVSAPIGDVVAAMNRLAKDINPDARALTGCDAAEQHLYGDILLGRAAPDSLKQAGRCVPIYLQSAEALLARGNREAVEQIYRTVLSLPLDPIDGAQFAYLRALAHGDRAASLNALQNLARDLPSDSDLLRNVGELQYANRMFQPAVQSFDKATRADPEDAQAWNDLGYARAAIHDLSRAREALEHYQRLIPPENPNGLDSLGEVSFYLGDFAAAERYFTEANQKNPQALGGRELLKAAQARMMTGDLAEADRIAARQPNWNDLERAQWEFITGRRKRAIARLEALQKNPAAALQLAIWSAQTGPGPAPPMSNDPLGRATAFLLSGQFSEALPLLEQLYGATNPGLNGQVRTLLAWTYARTGRKEAAAKLLDLYPIPLTATSGNPLLASLAFPRFVELRADLLHSEKDRRLAGLYAGDAPDRTQ